jgi:DNA-binding transcriptional regulator PaaX
MYHAKIAAEDYYRTVLNTMAMHGGDWVSRKDIIFGSGVSESSVTNAVSALKDRKIILVEEGKRGFYRLPTKSFAAWINAFRSVKPKSASNEGTLF